jgi:hypothetical protein
MERPIPSHNLEDTPWSNSELESWRKGVLRQPESFFVSPSPEPLATPRSIQAVGDPSYNYQMHFSGIPVGRTFALPPTSVPSVYLTPNNFPTPLGQNNSEPVPVHSSSTVLVQENPYFDGCPSPWADFTASSLAPKHANPHKETDQSPTAAYLSPSTITRPINRRSPSSASIHRSSTAISPTSPCDPGYPSPSTDVAPSPSTSNRANPLEEVEKESNKTKRPCVTRGGLKKK